MNYSRGDLGVSPVIGTILLVAITVVLAAVIAAVVMGFSGDPAEKKIGLNAKPASEDNATLILYGGESIPDLVKLEMIDHNSANGEYMPVWNKSKDGEILIGYPYTAENVARPPDGYSGTYDTRINVKGTFSDGKEVVLLIQPMTFTVVKQLEKSIQPQVAHRGGLGGNPPDVRVIALTGSVIELRSEDGTLIPNAFSESSTSDIDTTWVMNIDVIYANFGKTVTITQIEPGKAPSDPYTFTIF